MEILNYIDFIKTTVTGGKWQLSGTTPLPVPAIVISDNSDVLLQDEYNCVSNDSGICADLCLVQCDELLRFLSGKEEEWELLRSRLR